MIRKRKSHANLRKLGEDKTTYFSDHSGNIKIDTYKKKVRKNTFVQTEKKK